MTTPPDAAGAPPERSLRTLALRAASWSVGGRLLGQGLRLASNVVLARLLFPEAFGLTAIVAVFTTGLTMFSDFGIGPSIVYAKRAEEPAFLNTAWTIQILRGAFITIGALLLAWPVAAIYGESQLQSLLAVAGLQGVIQGFESMATHTQRRNIDLGPVVRLELLTQLATIPVMIVWAWLVPTVWALVGASLFGAALKTALSHAYLPSKPHRIAWDRDAAREVYRYGAWIFLSSVFTFAALQGDRLLLGYYLGVSLLGVYHIATRFTEALRSVQTRLTQSVLFPVFSEVARSNPKRMLDRYYEARLWTDLLFLGATGLLGSLAHVVIDGLYDDRYADAGWILRLLSIQLGMSAILSSQETLLFAIGKTHYGFLRSLARAVWVVAGIPLGWHYAQLEGVVWCVALSEIPVLAVIATGMVRHRLLRPLYELRSLGFWAASATLGWLVGGFFR